MNLNPKTIENIENIIKNVLFYKKQDKMFLENLKVIENNNECVEILKTQLIKNENNVDFCNFLCVLLLYHHKYEWIVTYLLDVLKSKKGFDNYDDFLYSYFYKIIGTLATNDQIECIITLLNQNKISYISKGILINSLVIMVNNKKIDLNLLTNLLETLINNELKKVKPKKKKNFMCASEQEMFISDIISCITDLKIEKLYQSIQKLSDGGYIDECIMGNYDEIMNDCNNDYKQIENEPIESTLKVLSTYPYYKDFFNKHKIAH